MYQASNVYFICGFAAIGGGLFGFDISSMSGVLGTEAYKQYFDNPKSYRQGAITASMPAGSLVGSFLQQWAITWGILIQYFIQYGAAAGIDGGPDDKNQSTAAFRIPWGVQMIPAWILLVGLCFFPSSPRWLASQDKWEEALQTLANLHGKGDKTHPTVLAQYREIEDSLRFDREEAANSYKNLVTRRMLKRVILGMSIQAWSQLCGMNIMMYYIVYIMEGANIASPLLTASIQYIINVLLTLPAILYLDKFGALQQHYGQPEDDPDSDVSWVVKDNRPVSSAIVACSYLFVATFATTWGPTSWTYPAEIYPSQIRAKAVSISTSTNWFWNMVLAFAVPPLLWNINYKMYYIFGTSHETKGFTLEEMDDVFDSGHPAWKKHNKVSRLENLAKDIEKGKVTVVAPGTGEAVEVGKEEKN
ncbi:hypothetical protein LRP88_05581 [Fusarium phalaenopsidis]